MIKRVVAGSSGLSILATAIYFLTSHISEVQYNNWGTGVWNDLLKISGTGNCESGSSDTQDDEYYKACIKKDIETYWDLSDFWNSSYWETWYKGKLKNETDKDKYLKFGSWEKFREVCTKGFDELIKSKNWSTLSGGVGPTSYENTSFPGVSGISIGDCISKSKTTSSK